MAFNKRVTALVLASALTSVSALGAPCTSDLCKGLISSLLVNAKGDVFVTLTGGVSGLSVCKPVQGSYLILSSSSQNFAQLYATLLAAETASRLISFSVVSGTFGCVISYVVT